MKHPTRLLFSVLITLLAAALALGGCRGGNSAPGSNGEAAVAAEQPAATPENGEGAGPANGEVEPEEPATPGSRPAATSPEDGGGPTPQGDGSEAASLAGEKAKLEAREAELARRELEIRERELARREAAVAEREAELAAQDEAAAPGPSAEMEPAAPAPAGSEPVVVEASDGGAFEEGAPAPLTPEPLDEPAATASTIPITVPVGTPLEVEFLDSVSSETALPGDRFRARVFRDVVVDGRVAIPAGSGIEGTVTEAVPLKEIGGQARLGLTFDRLELPSGERVTLHARFAGEGRSETAKDAAAIGGGAAGGAILGRILAGKGDKRKGTVLGAIVGAAVGTAIAAKTPGEEVTIPEGTVLELRLTEWVRVMVDE